MLDSYTPREVYVEYERRKRALIDECDRLGAHRDIAPQLEALADSLGLGVWPEDLTCAQRQAQARAIARAQRGSSCGP